MILPPLRRFIFIALTTIGLLILGTYYYFEYDRIKQYEIAIEERQKILQQKQDIVRDCQEMVDFYGTDEGIEHLAREQYNLVTPGDRVILLQGD